MATTSRQNGIGRRHLPALMALTVLTPVPAFAQAADAAAVEAPAESTMVTLIRTLIAQRAIKPAIGAALIRQAEAEAADARTARATLQAQQVQLAQAQQTQTSREIPAAAPGAIRVPYIPQSVRAQIKDELRNEVMAEAKQGQWASPEDAAPEWTRRITLHGDIRVRSQSELFSKSNANDIVDYATINALSPYGFEDPRVFLPYLNSRNDKWNHMRLRARIGIDAVVTKGVTAGITLATGDSASPISTNSSLGGGFQKRDVWLDKAWVKIQPLGNLSATFGRMGNPFTTSDLLYDADLNFDGVAFEAASGKLLGDDLAVTLRGGAFPYDFGNSDYPTFANNKPATSQKWLFVAQMEANAKFGDIDARVSVGLHDFHHFQSQLSRPCQSELAAFCSTDDLQPLFLTKGNTLSPLRQTLTPLNASDTTRQLLGYTFKYRVLDVNGAVTFPIDAEMVAHLTGAYVKNLAFKQGDICRNGAAGAPYNNNAAGTGTYCDGTVNAAKFAGGDTGYRAQALIGTIDPKRGGQWNVFAGYRYLESDAVLDALTDSDFHLGGTNSKGYFVGGAYAVKDNVRIGGKWMSANEISGPPLAIDVLQIDLQVNF